MASATGSRPERLGVGQLLVRLLYFFRQEMLSAAAGSGYTDLRPPHVHVLANMRARGIRLTELARRSQLSLGTTSVFVTELEDLGYLERRPDPDDGRAKRIVFTPRGQRLYTDAGKQLEQIEQRWAALIGDGSYEHACTALQTLLDQLTEAEPAISPPSPAAVGAGRAERGLSVQGAQQPRTG